jgi:hypothetical protein
MTTADLFHSPWPRDGLARPTGFQPYAVWYEGNPYTWPETRQSLHAMLGPYSKDIDVKFMGTDLDTVFHALLPGLGLFLPTWAKKPWARRFGWSLWAQGRKD